MAGRPNIKLGQRLVIPGGSERAGAAGEACSSPAVDPKATPAPTPAVANAGGRHGRRDRAAAAPAAAPAAPAQTAAVAPQAGADAAAAPQAAAAADGFRWPVRGRVISGFGKKPDGERNDGINLAVPEGSAVKAAEDGTVIYAGNELKSYGNLVLIRHNNGWVSAYAHNSKLEVARGQQGAARARCRAVGHERRCHDAAGAFRAAQGRHPGRPAAAPVGELRFFPSPLAGEGVAEGDG